MWRRGWAGGLAWLAVAWLATGGIAEAQGVTAALMPMGQTVSPGTDFDVELDVTQAGSPFNGFGLTVSYDPAALTLVSQNPISLQEGSLMTTACTNRFHKFNPGAGVDTISDILLCSGVNLTGPGQLYKLRFHASSTPQVTMVRVVAGTLQFYNSGLYVNPVSSSDARIGIGMTVGVGDPPQKGGLSLTANPNPSRGEVLFSTEGRSTSPETLRVRDLQGRIVRVLAVNGGRTKWNGLAESGEKAAPGIYFATLASGSSATTIRFSLVR